jgi:hypothetical protein
MGIVKGTVKQNSDEFCKFSVTFCVDTATCEARLARRAKIFGRPGVFHSGNRFRGALREGYENFLDGKIPASGGIRRGEN